MPLRLKQIKIASAIGILGNTLLALIKGGLGYMAGSLAVVGDGLDSATDVLSFIIIFFALKIMAKAPDEQHPYGHHRAEALATLIIAFIILSAGIQLFLVSMAKILTATESTVPSPLAMVASFCSILGKLLLALYQFKVGQKTNSSMLIANGRNMLADLYVSLGVLVGTVLTITFRLPLIDHLVAILISFWIMRTAVHIFLDANTELMEGVKDLSIYRQVFAAVQEVEDVFNPHRTRIRKLANLYLIDIDIEVDGKLTVAEGHRLAVAVEKVLRQRIENLYDVAVHVEPKGNIETEEKYGLSPQEISDLPLPEAKSPARGTLPD
ncbi:MAG: cation transporter [Firmicutes bacterium]|nr:cation transporter [Bacillota bacterium]